MKFLLRWLRSVGLWFKSSLSKNFMRTQLNGKKLGMVACAYHSSDGRKYKIGGSRFRPA
jgi:hypothetical protein